MAWVLVSGVLVHGAATAQAPAAEAVLKSSRLLKETLQP